VEGAETRLGVTRGRQWDEFQPAPGAGPGDQDGWAVTSVPAKRRAAQHGATQAARSVWVARLGRVGLGARGVLYVLLAYLAVLVAFGLPNSGADSQGALHTVARQRFGHVLLAGLAAGFGAYALWQLTVAALGASARAGSDKKAKRVTALLNGVWYSFLCVSTTALAAGSAGSAGGSKAEVDLTSKVMQHSFGRTAVGIAGAGLIVVGAVLVWQALSGQREFELQTGSASVRRGVETLAKVGRTARAVIIAAVGVFVVQAALTFDPGKAKGLDGTLKSFAHTPIGPWLLVLIAAGVLAFGAYSLAAARYAEI
jgi:hypothetical protein